MRNSTRSHIRLVSAAAVSALVTGATIAVAVPAAAAPSTPGVVRDGNSWLLRNSLSGGPATSSFTYGSPGDTIHVLGDWDGNGTKTAGVIRPQGQFEASQYVWFLRNGEGGGPADVIFAYGKPSFGFEEPGDVPVVGDWDGDGRDSAGVVRIRNEQVNALWLLRNAVGGGPAQLQFSYGLATDLPFVAGDWDGNGTDTPGAIRGLGQGTLTWLLRNANSGGPAQVTLGYGQGFDAPIVGDWDGNGADGVGVTRAVAGQRSWLLRNALTSGPAQLQFSYGVAADDPVVRR